MKKKIVLSFVLGAVMSATVFAPVGVGAQTVSVEETLIAINQQLILLVKALSDNFTQQFAAQDARISALENQLSVKQSNNLNVGSVSQSTQDEDAISALIKTLPDTPLSYCKSQGYRDSKSYDRIARLLCGQFGL